VPTGTRNALNFGGGSIPSVGVVVATEATAGATSRSDVSESDDTPNTAWIVFHVTGAGSAWSLSLSEGELSKQRADMSGGREMGNGGGSWEIIAIVGVVVETDGAAGSKNAFGIGRAGLRKDDGDK